MPRRLFVIVSLALLTWVCAVAHAMPIDADGPSGLSDNADLDDLIASFTSLTAAVAPMPVVEVPTRLNVIHTIAPSRPIPVRHLVRSSVEGRAPPLA